MLGGYRQTLLVNVATSLLQHGFPSHTHSMYCLPTVLIQLQNGKLQFYNFKTVSFHSTPSRFSVTNVAKVPNKEIRLLSSNWKRPKILSCGIRNYYSPVDLIATKESIDKGEFDDGYDVEDEAKRLKKEMEITIKEVEESKFYAKLSKQLRESARLGRQLRRVLGSHSHVPMVIYAIGSLEYCFRSHFQLAIAILLQRDFSNWIGEIEVYDPVLSPADKIVLKELGCTVLSVDERCRRQVERPTLFFMPYPYYYLVGNLLEANWFPSKINQVILLTGRISVTLDRYHHNKNKYRADKFFIDRMRFLEAIQKYTKEIGIRKNFGGFYNNIIYNFAWQFFNVKPEIDMKTLLPDKPSNKQRLKMNKAFDKLKSFHLLDKKKYVEKMFMIGFELYKSDQDNEDWWLYCHDQHRGPRRYRCSSDPPPAGWIKLNISGKGCDDNSPAGFGGIFHNDKKEPLAIFSGNLGEVDAIVANVEALRHALKCLQSMSHVKNLIVEGHHLSVIRWVNCCPTPPEKIREALAEIFALMKNINCVVYHIYEEANLPAIVLANKGAKLHNLHVWISKSEGEYGHG